jgi:hydroxymethylbilane synthase
MKCLTLGSRVSPLAMAQSRHIQSALCAAHGIPADAVPIEGFTTTGDRILNRSLQDAGGKGLFTKELDEALLDGRIDAAVHSMKDLPTKLPRGLSLVCVPAREDPRDAFISSKAKRLVDLPEGATLGTASLRRQAQALNLRPDLRITMLRGSVATRLQRVALGDVDSTFLGTAGLNRLHLADAITVIVPPEEMLPAVGQGALAIVCRTDDARSRELLTPVDVPAVHVATAAERAFLDALDGSCRTPIAAYATLTENRLTLRGELLTPDGRKRWSAETVGDLSDQAMERATALGRRLGAEIRGRAGLEMEAALAESSARWTA